MQPITLAARVARLQYGLITRTQLMELGMTERNIGRCIEAERLEPLHPGVYRMAGSPATWEQAVKAATLAAPGSAASHTTAAQLWGLLPRDPQRQVEILVPRTTYARLRRVITHRPLDLRPRYFTRRRHIPVTNPMLTLLHVGAVVPPPELEDAIDRGLSARIYSIAAIERLLTELARPGRNGAGALGRVLDERALGSAPTRGLLEPRFARLAARFGLPPYVYQHWLRVPGYGPASLDFAWPEAMVAVEVDGFETHGTPRGMEYDFERQNGLIAMGWSIRRFTWHMVVRRPGYVASTVLVAIEDAMRP